MPHELFIFNEIGPSWAGMISAELFAAALRGIPSDEDVLVRINSPGGEVFEGLAIHELIRDRGNVDVKVDGLAGSIASVIMLAGRTVEIAPAGMVVIHKPSTFAAGDAPFFRKVADDLDSVENVALNAYAKATELSTDKLSEMLAVETWMSAEEALELGFVDRIAGRGDDDDEHTMKIELGNVVKFKSVPPLIAAKLGSSNGSSRLSSVRNKPTVDMLRQRGKATRAKASLLDGRYPLE